ncbi:MAG: hypothetical protein QG657_2520 [Acidobacteriota bacterium]|nr:hypothetical protein [Acidobacteriota bacterium]
MSKNTDYTGLEIAIIGMAGRFPGAKNIEEYWENLVNGRESISFFTDEELMEAGVDPNDLTNPNYVKANGFLEESEYFDSSFFGYTDAEAAFMDPQMRIFHECAWESLEDAGYSPNTYSGLIGLYVGASAHFEWVAQVFSSSEISALDFFTTGLLMDKDFLGGWVAYKLDLKGPIITMTTACSTSLVTIHLACQGILNGECDMALAGGVSVTQPNKSGYFYQEGMIQSMDGHVRAFDAGPHGVVAGSGVAAVVLKRLEDAVKDRDHIYALIKGSAINNDGGNKVGFAAPTIHGQARVIKAALDMAVVDPESIGYVETHGTATELGDPVEIQALKLAFNTDKRQYCRIGSVKTNIGHLDAAAGAAGLIKAALCLFHKIIPASLNYKRPNPSIDFENTPFYVNAELSGWNDDSRPLRAGVSSFGIGGTNAHAVLEEWPLDETRKIEGREYHLLLLSARTQSALAKMTGNLAAFLGQNPGINLSDAAYTLMMGRKNFAYRRMLVCKDIDDAIAAFSTPDSRKIHTFFSKEQEKPVIFMFPGLGSQYVNMGRELYEKEPVFRYEMDNCFEILKPLIDYDIKEILYPGEESDEVHEKIKNFEVAQLVIFIFEYALAQLITRWGVKPDAMIGYSFGEYAAACLSGVLSLEDTLILIVSRGKLIGKLPPGAMLSVPLPREELKPQLNEKLSIAIDNGASCIVAGPLEAINALEEQLKMDRCMCIPMNSSHAIHSQMMTPILQAFEESAGKIKINKPQIPYISNLTGTWTTAADVVNSAYWARHLGETVQFADGIKELLRKERAVFVEVGPGRDLNALVGRYFDNSSNYQILNLVKSADQDISDIYHLLNKIGQLWLYGHQFEWLKFYSHQTRGRISLPAYPFEKQHYWIEGDLLKMMEKSGLVQKSSDIADWAYLPLWKRSFPGARNKHKIQSDSNCLIFLNDLPFGKKLVEKLVENHQDVVIVKIGDAFEQPVSDTKPRTYTINPGEFSHYDILFGQLHELGILPHNIIHCWNLTTRTDTLLTRESFDAAQYLGFYSLLYMVKATEKQNLNNDIHISFLTNHLQEVTGAELLCPEKAPALGLLKSIPQEFPGIICRSIDIILPEPASPGEISLIDLLVAEFAAKDEDVTIAFRDNRRWVQFFDPFHLEAPGRDPARSRLRKQGVYLVTGGLGNIGLIISEVLVKRVEARLILIGRSTFPAENEWLQWLQAHDESDPISLKIKKLQRLREMGGKILYLQADVAIEEQMRRVVSQAEATFGKINGVIHAAGITEGDSMRLINQLSDNDCLLQFYPKVYGSMVLEKLFENEKLDFFWLLSSISCILGGLGFGAYAGANFFMDIFAKKYNRLRSSNSSWFSLNWDGMDPEKSAALFERILESEEMDQLVISNNGNLQQRIDQWIKLKSLHGKMNFNNDEKYAQPFKTSPNITNPYVAPQNPLEQKFVEIFESFFMIKPVGIYDDFFELGGDSLRAVQLTSIIKKLGGGIKISIHEVLLYRNIHDICAGLGKEGGIGMMENIVNPPPPASEEKKLALKGEVSPGEQRLMEKKLEEIDRLSGLLKENKRTRCYEVSPVQASWLIPPHHKIPTNFVYYFHDFSYPVGHEKISDFVKTLTQRNSLLRSVIINEKGNYFIEEFDAFPNIRMPLIDVSSYSDACRETIIDRMISYLNKPMELFDHVLFRPWVLRLDHTHFRLFLQLNHLIFDGASVGVLDEQFNALKHGIEGPQRKSTPITDYYDYVQFMKEQNYDHTGLDKYLNLKDYFHANKVILKKYEMANTEYESFEVDISSISAKFKDYYNEIAFLAFVKLIGDLFGVDKVPIEYITNGRNYKGGDFNHIIGDFHDTIPVLVSLPADPKSEIDRFVDYNRFIKENKLHFMSYMQKGYITGLDLEKETLRPPFSFNALIGSYDFFKKPFNERILATVKYTSPHFDMLLLEDFSADKLWITFIQNSGFTIKEVFMKNYFHLVDSLNKESFVSGK